MLSIYRELLKGFPGLASFDGWMIAKAEFKIIKQTLYIHTKDDNTIERDVKNKIIKQRKSYAVILAVMVYKDMEYNLIIHLIKPAEINFTKDGFKQVTEILPSYADRAVYLYSSAYSKLCIKEFTKCTGDSNYIHQLETPVVPGMLMFEDVLENGFCVNNKYSGLECFKIIFRKPVFADEIINLYKTEDNRIFAMPAQGDKCILWELVLC